MCEYCFGKNEKSLYEGEKGEGKVFVFVYDDFHGEGIAVIHNDKDRSTANNWTLLIPTNYCPMCGRKLG